MKLECRFDDLPRIMQAEAKAGEKAATAATREAGSGLKTAWRGALMIRASMQQQFFIEIPLSILPGESCFSRFLILWTIVTV